MNPLLEVINKQRRVRDLMQHQSMLKHDIAASLLQRQHDAELSSGIAQTTAQQLAQCLNTLDTLGAQRLWQLIPPEQANRVLWNLPESRRMELNLESPAVDLQRIQCYELSGGRLIPMSLQDPQVLKSQTPVWVDLVDITPGERRFVEELFQLSLPELLDENELEVTARFQVSQDDDLLLHSNFLGIQAQHARSVPVAFMVRHGVLFSIRRESLSILDLQKQRARNQPGYVQDAWDVLIDLYAADVECSADALENIYGALGQVGRHVLSESISDQMAAGILSNIAEEEDHNGRIRSNILDTQRALNFLLRGRMLSENQIQDCRQIQRNIESLNSHTSFLFDKINFLMDSTIGFININQNKRVNQLTIFSVVFMPINILAGVGGMSEFSMMTQGIEWPVAYGGFMMCSAFIGWITYRVLGHLERKRALSSDRRPPH